MGSGISFGKLAYPKGKGGKGGLQDVMTKGDKGIPSGGDRPRKYNPKGGGICAVQTKGDKGIPSTKGGGGGKAPKD